MNEIENDEKEQEQLNASFQRIIELETQEEAIDLCVMCQSVIKPGISFCNARCETHYDSKWITIQ